MRRMAVPAGWSRNEVKPHVAKSGEVVKRRVMRPFDNSMPETVPVQMAGRQQAS